MCEKVWHWLQSQKCENDTAFFEGNGGVFLLFALIFWILSCMQSCCSLCNGFDLWIVSKDWCETELRFVCAGWSTNTLRHNSRNWSHTLFHSGVLENKFVGWVMPSPGIIDEKKVAFFAINGHSNAVPTFSKVLLLFTRFELPTTRKIWFVKRKRVCFFSNTRRRGCRFPSTLAIFCESCKSW